MSENSVHMMAPFSVHPPNTKCGPQNPQYVTNNTASDDPSLIKSRIFAGCLNKEQCKREDIIELFSMYGPLIGLTHFPPAGFAYVQFENIDDAQSAVRNLNNFLLHGRKMVVKIADPKMQKPLNEGQNQGPSQNQGNSNPKFQKKQFNKPFNKQAPRQDRPNELRQFGAFGKGPNNAQSKFSKGQSKFSKRPEKFATASNAIPLGSQQDSGPVSNQRGRGGFKNKKPMPRQQPKKPRFSNEFKGQKQYDYNQQSEYSEQDNSYYDQYSYSEQPNTYGEEPGYSQYNPEDPATTDTGYQGFENPYGEIGYGAEEGQYEEGQYTGEYTEAELADYYAQYGYEYDPNAAYYDEFGQPIEYAPTEGEVFDNQDYTADYYDQPIPAEQQYEDDYSSLPQHPSPKNAPNLGPPSKPRKAEFVNPQKPATKVPKQPQVVQELEERSIHYNYEIPDFFVCGGCHFSTANPQYFVQHRSKPCKIKQVKRGEDEPENLQCHMCSESCKNAWDLVAHMGRKHCLYLFNETHLAGGITE